MSAISDLPPLKSGADSNKYFSEPKNDFQKKMRGDSNLLTEHNSSNYGPKMKKILSLIPKNGSVKDLPKCKPRQDSKNLMDNIVDVCTGQRKTLKIFGDDYSTPDGTAERDYIHIKDLVYAHFEALNYFNHIKGFDVFNIGTGKSVSVKQIVKTFKESNEVDFPVEISKRREGDVSICYADANKAKKLLNWETKKSLREMCIDAWSCYK